MKRITVLLGAGSTLRAAKNDQGTPSTEELNSLIQADPFIQKIYGVLSQKYNSPNFELVLNALEELEPYLISQPRDRLKTAQFDPVISDFTELKRDLGFPIDRMSVRIARQTAIKNIFSHFVERLSSLRNPEELYLKNLVDKFREHFSLQVFTLNYDDLIDMASDSWFDGFLEQSEGKPFHEFDGPSFLQNIETEESVLVHLHGSIRFGFNAPPPGRHVAPGAIVKYRSPPEALGSLQRTFTGETYVDGQIVSLDPIVSGLDKIDKLALNPSPYGYYYHGFIRSMIQNSSLLIIGYGGQDPHINRWLREFAKVHGERRKIVLITKLENPPFDFDVRIIGEKPEVVFTKWNESRNKELKEYGPFLRLLPSGFPFQDPKILDKIIEYLDS